jgi:hypothetical protein
MEYNQDILKKFDTFFTLFHNVEQVFKETIKDIKIKAASDIETLIGSVYLLHFPKMLSHAQSSIELIKKGYKLDSDILVRSFFETYVNLRYVEKVPKFRALLFQLSELNENIEWKQYIFPMQESNGDKKQLAEKINANKAEREDVIKELIDIDSTYCEDYKKFLWKKISMEDRCKDIGMENKYKFIFVHLSESVHSSPNATNKMLAYSDSIVYPILQPVEDYNMIPEKTTLIIEYLLNTLIFVEINLKIELEKIVKPLTTRFNKLTQL